MAVELRPILMFRFHPPLGSHDRESTDTKVLSKLRKVL
jgi:hypothetical protein